MQALTRTAGCCFPMAQEKFFSELAKYAGQRLGARASEKITAVLALIKLIEHGYRAILDVLDNCPGFSGGYFG